MDYTLEFEIMKRYKSLRPSEQKVADFILSGGAVEEMTIVEVATTIEVSQPTIIRFANALGIKGFKELKHQLLQEKLKKDMKKTAGSPLHGFHIEEQAVIKDVPANIISTTIKLLQETLMAISVDQYVQVIEAIVRAKSIAVFGVENSCSTVNDLVTKLMYLGLNCTYYSDYYLQSISATNLGKEDVAIGISFSGCSQNTVDVLKSAKESGATTIAITNFENALINEYADYVLCGSSEQFLYGNSIFSRTSQIAMVDMIYTGILVSDYDRFTKKMDQSSNVISSRAYDDKKMIR